MSDPRKSKAYGTGFEAGRAFERRALAASGDAPREGLDEPSDGTIARYHAARLASESHPTKERTK